MWKIQHRVVVSRWVSNVGTLPRKRPAAQNANTHFSSVPGIRRSRNWSNFVSSRTYGGHQRARVHCRRARVYCRRARVYSERKTVCVHIIRIDQRNCPSWTQHTPLHSLAKRPTSESLKSTTQKGSSLWRRARRGNCVLRDLHSSCSPQHTTQSNESLDGPAAAKAALLLSASARAVLGATIAN